MTHIKVFQLSEEGLEENNYKDKIVITINDREVFEVHDSEDPEDNNMGRNFNGCLGIPELLENAYKCKSDDYKMTYHTFDSWDELHGAVWLLKREVLDKV